MLSGAFCTHSVHEPCWKEVCVCVGGGREGVLEGRRGGETVKEVEEEQKRVKKEHL